ncbi:hypothetical protein SAMN02910265_02220 [Ruminococcus flavefaciens]|uniref:Uncharacterized protein n=1 Tax=Ruminococcus flavefaciens TaxID=1265 RepID=A0A1H6KEX3_RUMFL|nr:hypothetical protein [Ruminococcus flavefaciens]SEH70036.1 hypothetical protein SAMN02910265_02220 [Ruminococcus flavefaciens]
MNKFMKKAMAAACALAVVGGVPTAFGTEIFPPALTASAAENEVTLTEAQVELASSITLDFYADKSSLAAASVDSVELSGPNGVKNISVDADSEVFSYDLYPTQLGEDVTIKFKNGDDIVKIADKGESFKYTVNDYCAAVEAGSSTDYTDEAKNAAKSLKNLGIASDNYFNNKDTAITFMDESYDLSSYAPDFGEDTTAKISLLLDSITKFRVYIDGLTVPESADLEDSDGVTSIYSQNGKNGKACFESTFLYPQFFSEVQTITYGSKTYKASALSYCFRALNSSDAKTQNIGKAAYEYYKYITAYLA